MYLDKRGIFRYLNGIRDAGDRASGIVSNLIHFTKNSGSRMIVNLSKLLDDTIQLAADDDDLKHTYDFGQIKILREYDPDLGEISCNMPEFEHVVFNLLKNAAQALSETKDPTIIIRTKSEGESVRIELEDNGPGMNEDVKKRIFEPFYTTKTVGTGTGLGLSISYFIITHNHKGMLVVKSELGKGSRFVIRLPKL